MNETAKAKLHEVTGRIETTSHLIEECIGNSLADRRPGAGAEECLDVTEDIVETGPGRTGR